MIPADSPLFTASNRSFKWGDGVFETMKVHRGKILLEELHLERLAASLTLLQMDASPFDVSLVRKQVLALCSQNDCTSLARVRLGIYRIEGSACGYVIEAQPALPEVNEWKEDFVIDMYPFARKSMDAFASLKSANFLPYVLAGLYAGEKGWDDAVVLNAANKIADTSKANIFYVRDQEFYTPALNQGCINGVMRRFLVENLHKHQFPVHQVEVDEQDLMDADEIFLTNAVYGMRGISRFRNKKFSSELSASIYNKLVKPLFEDQTPA